jgi:hypothetical protein
MATRVSALDGQWREMKFHFIKFTMTYSLGQNIRHTRATGREKKKFVYFFL